MKPDFQIRIPEPCHENWHKMQPNEQGRFCLNCQKTVMDFSQMSDREVLNYFSNYSGNVCGRFHKEQLNRNIILPKRNMNWLKYVMKLVIPAFLLANKVYSQPKKTTGVVSTCTPKKKPSHSEGVFMGEVMMPQKIKNKTISGKVSNEYGNAIYEAEIQVKGMDFRTKTDTVPLILPSPPLETEAILAGGIELSDYTVQKTTPMIHQLKSFVKDTLGINKVKVYPNPAPIGKNIYIECPVKEKGTYGVQLFNLNGQLLKQQTLSIKTHVLNTSMPLSNIVPGQYVVRIVNSKRRELYNGKIIIQ